MDFRKPTLLYLPTQSTLSSSLLGTDSLKQNDLLEYLLSSTTDGSDRNRSVTKTAKKSAVLTLLSKRSQQPATEDELPPDQGHYLSVPWLYRLWFSNLPGLLPTGRASCLAVWRSVLRRLFVALLSSSCCFSTPPFIPSDYLELSNKYITSNSNSRYSNNNYGNEENQQAL